MLTAMLAVRNLHGEQHDLWSVNADEEYHEELSGRAGDHDGVEQFRSRQPNVPVRIEKEAPTPRPTE